MNTGEATINADEFQSAQFCALQYSSQEIDGPPALERVIVLLIRHESGVLRVLCRQDWPTIVQPSDFEYIRDLLADFKERASTAPDALFKQVSSLSVGPLVTNFIGSGCDLKSDAGLVNACESMINVL